MAEQPGVPVFLRIGDNDEHHLGDLCTSDAMPALLRHAADQFERGLTVPTDQPDDQEI